MASRFALPLAVLGLVAFGGLASHGQEFALQPLPMPITAGPIAPAVQSFDQPLPGARSPRNANYEIDVRLDVAAKTIQGREILRWRNITREQATELQFHLYWNAWRDTESTWMRERRLTPPAPTPRSDAWSRIDIVTMQLRRPEGNVDLLSGARFIAPDDGNASDRTVMAVPLPEPVQPLAAIEIEITWTARVPRPFARTGFVGDYYFLGQWFPKIGVLEDGGWNTHQFHRVSEFYADFGVYDVRMTIPRGWVVGASGREVERKDNADGTTTHRYHGEDIIDFAWTTSPDFLERRHTFTHTSLPQVELRLLLQPEHASQADRHVHATSAALTHYGEWFGPYPYPNLTIVDPAYQSRSGGMEYPTLFTVGTSWLSPSGLTDLEDTAIHEAGHQWWYAVVASNEFEHGWMDEGLNQFADIRTFDAAGIPDFVARYYVKGFLPWVFRDLRRTRVDDQGGLARYQEQAEGDAQATPTFRYWPGTSTSTTYFKTNLWLFTLERMLGWPTVQRILRTYYERWKFRHPRPEDFFRIANEVSGTDLTPFFNETYRSSNAFDYGIQTAQSERVESGQAPFRTVVVAHRIGEAVFPVDVLTRFEDGTERLEQWSGHERRRTYEYWSSTRAVRVQVDPRRVLLLDVNYTNNSWTAEPRAGEASWKWALTWMLWLQELLVTYAWLA